MGRRDKVRRGVYDKCLLDAPGAVRDSGTGGAAGTPATTASASHGESIRAFCRPINARPDLPVRGLVELEAREQNGADGVADQREHPYRPAIHTSTPIVFQDEARQRQQHADGRRADVLDEGDDDEQARVLVAPYVGERSERVRADAAWNSGRSRSRVTATRMANAMKATAGSASGKAWARAVSGPSASAPISSCMVARQKIEPKV